METSTIVHTQLKELKDVWFNDGNVLLQAENILFKVYQGFLVKESPLFQDMFSLSQPETATESHDGCAFSSAQSMTTREHNVSGTPHPDD
jgi:hypothetical protein